MNNRIPLSEHLKTLGNREELIGLKVWDSMYSDELLKIDKLEINDWVWCYFALSNSLTPIPISRLSIDLSEQEK